MIAIRRCPGMAGAALAALGLLAGCGHGYGAPPLSQTAGVAIDENVSPHKVHVEIRQNTSPGQLVGIAVSPTGVPWFADITNSAIGFEAKPGSFTEFKLSNGGQFYPFGVNGFTFMAFYKGDAWFPHNGTNSIGRITPSGAEKDFPIPSASAGPNSVVVGPDNAIWFNEFNTGKVGRIAANGKITEYPLPGLGGSLSLIVGPDKNLWAGQRTGYFTRFSVKNTVKSMKQFSVEPPACTAFGVTVGKDAAFYWPCIYGYNGGIGMIRMTTSGGVTSYPLSSQKGVTVVDPALATLGKDGAVWFTDRNSNYIGRFTTTKVSLYPYRLIHGNGAGNAGAGQIVSAPNGDIYFDEFNTGNVGEIILSDK
ncbi:MAG TPA: hypothetical protein VMF61_10675 [Candidatus Acidoferrales bacterium]|nr:hypothetical protein [Candidatus Acidoferrales bacterium]